MNTRSGAFPGGRVGGVGGVFFFFFQKEREKRRDLGLLVLSASPQINRKPVLSYMELMRPASASSDPGWAVVSND